jgi:hypothetical protein
MRNLLALVGLATVTFFGLGWYLGWYKFERTSGTNGNNISIGINTKKVTGDVQRGIQGVSELIDSLGSKPSNQSTQTSTSWYEPAPAKTQPVQPAPSSWYDPTPVPPATSKPRWTPIRK